MAECVRLQGAQYPFCSHATMSPFTWVDVCLVWFGLVGFTDSVGEWIRDLV